MSLKTDFYDGATGINDKLQDSFNLGVLWLQANLSAISALLLVQAAKGIKDFELSIATTDNLTNMMSNFGDNLIAKAYMAGIQYELANEGIFSFECSLSLVGTTGQCAVHLTFTL